MNHVISISLTSHQRQNLGFFNYKDFENSICRAYGHPVVCEPSTYFPLTIERPCRPSKQCTFPILCLQGSAGATNNPPASLDGSMTIHLSLTLKNISLNVP